MKQRLMGSRKFWMVLAAFLGVFTLLASILLLLGYSDITGISCCQRQVGYVEQSTNEDVDRSFEATKDRVDSINGNFGQQVKSAYSGETSTSKRVQESGMAKLSPRLISKRKNLLLRKLLMKKLMTKRKQPMRKRLFPVVNYRNGLFRKGIIPS